MFWSEPPVGYRGFIAIHNMALGPVMGGTRFWDYQTPSGKRSSMLSDWPKP